MTKKYKLLLIAIVCVFLAIVIAGGIKLNSMKNELESTKTELSNYTVDESTIAPCPFCGSQDVSVADVCGDGSRYVVECDNCNAKGPFYFEKNNFDNITKQDAITLWNKASK